jgi:hypothetical protein
MWDYLAYLIIFFWLFTSKSSSSNSELIAKVDSLESQIEDLELRIEELEPNHENYDSADY